MKNLSHPLLRLMTMLFFGISTTIYVWWIVDKTEQMRIHQDFENRAMDLETAISRQIENALFALKAIEGFFNSNPQIQREEFREFTVNILAYYDSIHALGWTPRVKHAQREAYVTAAREDGLNEFQFTERNTDGELRTRSVTDAYSPVYYLEPLKGNQTALGFDLASNPERLVALEQSAASGTPVATAPITLVQETGSQTGAIVYLPIYDRSLLGAPNLSTEDRIKALRGHVSSVFRVGNLVSSALADLDLEGVVVQVFDKTGKDQIEMIYPAKALDTKLIDARSSTYLGYPKMPGRNWQIMIQQKPGFQQAQSSMTTVLVIPTGLLLTALLILFYWQSLSKEKLVANRRFQQVVEAFPQAVLGVDGDGMITLANRASETLFGFSPEEMHGKPLERFAPGIEMTGLKNRPGDKDSFETIETKEREGFIVQRDGHQVPVEINSRQVDSRDNLQSVVILLDIALRKEAEQRRRDYEAKLKQSNEDLQQFAYVASHDLKAPLRSIGSFVDLLQSRYLGEFDDQADKWIKIISGGVNRMQVLIDDLLAFSRVKSAGRKFESVDTGEVVEETLELLHSTINDAGARVSIVGEHSLPIIRGDRMQLIQLFQNLIENAIKYRKENDPLKVNISVTSTPEGDSWVFSVKDNGIGIDSAHREKIFDIFRRLHGPNEYDGSGVGLAICRGVLQRHGGEIWLGEDTEVGKGSVFQFRIGGVLSQENNEVRSYGIE